MKGPDFHELDEKVKDGPRRKPLNFEEEDLNHMMDARFKTEHLVLRGAIQNFQDCSCSAPTEQCVVICI